jgi:hypothetical protein
MLLLFLACAFFSAPGQKENIPTTENFSIEGKVKKTLVVSLDDLSSYKSYSIDSIVITKSSWRKKKHSKKYQGGFC